MNEPPRFTEPPTELGLSPAEWGLWQAFRNGSEYDLRVGDPELDDPAGDHFWSAQRSVRARVIALLLLHGPPPLLGRVASLHLTGAYITGRLDLSGGVVEPYLELRHCRFEQEVLLPECRIPTARLVHCFIPRLEAAQLTTDGDLHMPLCTAPGGIRLTDANIGTDLTLNEVKVGSGGRARAISADGMSVAQDLQASLMEAAGEVSMRGVHVGGSLYMYGSVLRNHHGRFALNAPQLTVERSAHLSAAVPGNLPVINGTTPVNGVPCLAGPSTAIGGTGGTSGTGAGTGTGPRSGTGTGAGTETGTGPGTRATDTGTSAGGTAGSTPAAPSGSRDTVNGVYRFRPFECTGGVRLDDGRFGDTLNLDRARFQLERDQELSLRRVQTPELCFTPERPRGGRVVLSGASVENLVDKVTSWPVRDGLMMAGFTYQQLIPRDHFPLSHRLQWVATATPEYAPGPYEQLATVLRSSGEDAEARLVLLEKHRRHRETLALPGKLWGYLQDWTVAYGYRPVQAALWMMVLWASGTLYFSWHPPHARIHGEEPDWNPALYVLDLLVPLINLGQSQAWRPTGHYQWTATAMILAGWVLATTIAAGTTRLLRRE